MKYLFNKYLKNDYRKVYQKKYSYVINATKNYSSNDIFKIIKYSI